MKLIAGFFRGFLYLTALLCGSANSLNGADLNLYLKLIGGSSALTHDHAVEAGGQSYSITPINRFLAGASAGMSIAPFLALEAGFRFEKNKLQVQALVGSPAAESIDFTVQRFFLNAVYHTPYSNGGLRLFATGGVGLTRGIWASGTEIFGTMPDSEIAPGFNFGGGLEARASRRLSLAAEVRDFVGNMPNVLQSSSPREIMHDVHMSIGVVVHLR